MTQSAGLLVPDTKLDLALDPAGFLARALHLWDIEGAFGQLQNQAYGYLWPMGPFFLLGSLLNIDGWIVQRLWMALVLCTAFVGAAKVTRALGVRSDLGCLVAGFAFALSPRMLTVIGPSSIEVWPSALAPWVLLPLVLGAQRGSPRRAAARSALAVAMVGGVNAVATFAVIPLGALWILTRESGARRRALLLWWPFFVLLGTLWWLVPLFTLGAYSPPFLDFIESAGVTTVPTTVVEALRGTSNWVPYVDAQSSAGRDLLTEFYLILNTGTLVVLGVAGLALTRNSHRRFLLSGVFVGVFLVTMGHTGQAQGIFADGLKALLDGTLAPLRNVHKFDPIIRLPLVVGLAFVVEEARSRLISGTTHTGRRADRITAGVLVGSIVVALAGATTPFVQGHVAARNGFTDVPGYWRDAAAWLGDQEDDGVALLVPGSSFGTYIWGEPRDEPFQALAQSAWAVRNAVPLVPAANIRMLNTIEEHLTQGRGGPGLSTFLARAGISHVVVRNDLVRTAAVADPTLVHQALDNSPGLTLSATFGPEIGGEPEFEGDLGRALVNGGWQSNYPAIEVYEVDDAASFAEGVDDPTVVIGGPEDLLDAADAGAVGTDPTMLAMDADPNSDPSGGVLLTDGLRLVERNFGSLHDATSPTLSGAEPATLPGLVHDYDLVDQERWTTRSRLVNAESVNASSSRSDAGTPGGSRPGTMPFAAVDGDPATSWVSAPFPAESQRWWIDFGEDRDLSEIAVTLGPNYGAEQLRLRTADWESPVLEFEPGETRKVVGPGLASQLWIEDVSGRPSNDVSISEVVFPGPPVVRELVLPDLPPAWGNPDAILLRRLGDGRTGCAEVDGAVRCRVGQAGSPEESGAMRRTFELSSAGEFDFAMSVQPRTGMTIASLIQSGLAVGITASSAAVDDQRASASAMIDGNPGTTWVAGLEELHPVIEINLLRPTRIRGLAVGVEAGTAARRPESFTLTWPGGSRLVELNEDGAATFKPIRTSQLRLEVQDAEPATDLNFAGAASNVPVGIGELQLVGVPYLPVAFSEDTRDLGCGSGPTVQVGAETYRTRVRASAAQLLAQASVPASLCGSDTLPLSAGANALSITPSDAFVADSVLLGSIDPVDPVPVPGQGDADTRRFAPSGSDFVASRENVNPGWQAQADGQGLAPQVFDGWRQGWQVSSTAPISARFVPDGFYRWGLVAGWTLVMVLIVLAVWPVRRPEPAAVHESRGFRLAWLGTLVAAAVLVLGWPAGALTLGATVLLAGARNRLQGWEGWGLAALLVPSVGAYVFVPWGGVQWAGAFGWPSYFALLALASVAAWVALTDRRDVKGRSTSQ